MKIPQSVFESVDFAQIYGSSSGPMPFFHTIFRREGKPRYDYIDKQYDFMLHTADTRQEFLIGTVEEYEEIPPQGLAGEDISLRWIKPNQVIQVSGYTIPYHANFDSKMINILLVKIDGQWVQALRDWREHHFQQKNMRVWDGYDVVFDLEWDFDEERLRLTETIDVNEAFEDATLLTQVSPDLTYNNGNPAHYREYRLIRQWNAHLERNAFVFSAGEEYFEGEASSALELAEFLLEPEASADVVEKEVALLRLNPEVDANAAIKGKALINDRLPPFEANPDQENWVTDYRQRR